MFYIGGLVGESSVITSSYATGAVTTGNSAHNVGGLVGSNGVTTDSYATGAVTSGDDSSFIGGFAGSSTSSLGSISSSYATGAVTTGNGPSYIGGLVGYNFSSTVRDSYATGAVTTGNQRINEFGYNNFMSVGGLAGYNTGTIEHSYASGSVTSGNYASYVGGLVGLNAGAIRYSYTTNDQKVTANHDGVDYVGGLVGSNIGIIMYSQSHGSVTVGDHANRIGGVAGSNRGYDTRDLQRLYEIVGNIDNATSSSNIIAGNHASYVGGISGDNYNTINKTVFSGEINVGCCAQYVGGITGANIQDERSPPPRIISSSSLANVSAGAKSNNIDLLYNNTWDAGITSNNRFLSNTVLRNNYSYEEIQIIQSTIQSITDAINNYNSALSPTTGASVIINRIINGELPLIMNEMNARKMALEQKQVILSGISRRDFIFGLNSSNDPIAKAVGQEMTEMTMAQNRYADIRRMLLASGVDANIRQNYLLVALRAQKDLRTEFYSGALSEIPQTPGNTLQQTTSSRERPGQTAIGNTASSPSSTSASIITRTDVDRGVFSGNFTMPTISQITTILSPDGKRYVQGRIDGWVMDQVSAHVKNGELYMAILDDHGAIQEKHLIVSQEMAEALDVRPTEITGLSGGNETELPKKIDGWKSGRQVRFNGKWVFIQDDGVFKIKLTSETTEIPHLVLIDEQGNVVEQPLSIGEQLKSANNAATSNEKPGRKIALLIGNADYNTKSGIPDLQTPLRDIEMIGQTLKSKLGFDARLLKNATKTEIIDALRGLRGEVGEQDQIVIYYAGHGYEVEKTGAGYWLPTDATPTSVRNWISNKDVGILLSRIPAKNIMVIADSCYSGSLTTDQKVDVNANLDLEKLSEHRGVMVMSSGGDEPVMDGEKNSPFARILNKKLNELNRSTLGISLYHKVRADVVAEVPQTPQYGAITTAGYDDGADFLIQPNRNQ
ncbi:hypothetical protein CCP2SC5_110001 [Azospirillaceae bacterium]